MFAVPAGYPVISENPTWKTVQKDSNATLTCRATGHPTPTVSWLKNFVPLDVSDARISVLPSGSVLLLSALCHCFCSICTRFAVSNKYSISIVQELIFDVNSFFTVSFISSVLSHFIDCCCCYFIIIGHWCATNNVV